MLVGPPGKCPLGPPGKCPLGPPGKCPLGPCVKMALALPTELIGKFALAAVSRNTL